MPDLAWEGEQVGFWHADYDDRLWREVSLPNSFDAMDPALESYEGAVWFRRSIAVPLDWQDKQVQICFQAVNYHAKVWVNGQYVGGHEDGFLPFSLNAGEALAFGEANVLVVRADNVRRQGEVPGLQRGWRTFGGILREVELQAKDRLCLGHLAVTSRPAAEGGDLNLVAELMNDLGIDVEVDLRLRLSETNGDEIGILETGALSLQAEQRSRVALDWQIAGVQTWSPSDPHLYRLEVYLLVGGNLVDECSVQVGFRTIEVCDGRLCLNGEPLYLTGFNRHEDSPRTGMTSDLELVRRDLVDIKAAGANFVRMCHYPHHQGELDLCDQLGLLVMCEIPLYWWNGEDEGQEMSRAKLAAAERQLTKLIRRDANHPSVIFWSVSNETEEGRPEVAAGNQHLVRCAKELDPSRLAVHVSNHWHEHPSFEADDVICVNGYPSLEKRGFDADPTYELGASTHWWHTGLQALHERYPEKPILVTEFGYASLAIAQGTSFGPEAQAEAIAHEFAGMDAPYVCGATIWCWADHPWPAATFSFCRYLAQSPYGVVTRDRRKLKAYWLVRDLFHERQGIQVPQREGSAEPGAGGYELHLIRSHMRDIPYVAFPQGFGIRALRPGEGALWLDIQRDSEPYFPIPASIFHQEFGYDLPATQWRSFLVTNERGVGVGVISAWYNRNFRGLDYGQVHWVAIRPSYQGKGLGKAALSYTLNQLAQWHERAYLGTQSKRIPAIKLYLDFGFLPDLVEPGALEGWREVKRALKHPILEAMEEL